MFSNHYQIDPNFYNFTSLLLRYTGWPKKVSHYRESSLNHINNRQPG